MMPILPCFLIILMVAPFEVQEPAHLMPIRLTPDETAALYRERFCVRSFPWPGGPTDVERFGQGMLRSTEMARIRDRVQGTIERYLTADPTLGDDADATARQVIAALQGGGDAEQLRLYCDYLYFVALQREKRYVEIVRGVRLLRSSYDVSTRPVESDPAEEHTYFSRGSLLNRIARLEADANSRLGGGDAGGARNLDEEDDADPTERD